MAQSSQVLIVDDARATRDMLRMALEDVGYDVLEAADGATALDLLRAARGHVVVLLDYLMPDMTGLDVLRAMRDDARLASPQSYILMTAQQRGLPPGAAEVLAALAARVIHKPFDLDALLEAIAEMAARAPMRQPA